MNASPGAHDSISITAIEAGATLIAFTIAYAWPRAGSSFFARIERSFSQLAERRGLSVAIMGLSVIALRLALLPLFPIPLPFVPDDFSFLLAADTFAHGRLANPTPAMWTHFESIHITMWPTYQSMYFPGQGLMLAAGQFLFGHPWFALLIVNALLCAALTWMLQAWLPRNWALLGGFIAVLRLALFSDWMNSYHTAGALAALGGALVLGALPRLIKTSRFSFALLLGVGIVVLAYTRPYEGMLLCLPVAAALIRWMIKGKNCPSALVLVRRAVLPVLLIAAALAWLGYYDMKAFGKATTLPYTIDRNTYAITPYYIWQHQRPSPVYRSAEMQKFYQVVEMDFYRKIHSASGFLPFSMVKVLSTLLFFGGPLLFLPLMMVRRVFLDRRIRFLVLCTLVLMAGMAVEIYLMPYYVAPFTAVFYAIGLQAMRHLRVWKPEGRPVGITTLRFIVLLCVALAGVRVISGSLGLAPQQWPPSNWNLAWYGPGHFGTARAEAEDQLSLLPGKQLAIVRYSAAHETLDEWVYNRADIDGSKVVWARDMQPADNLELVRFYRDRTVWLVEPDAVPARITPFPMPESAAAR